jgi:hypothetical protein
MQKNRHPQVEAEMQNLQRGVSEMVMSMRKGVPMESKMKILNGVMLLIAVVLLFAPTSAKAVPQFARRYNLTCSACHTIVPVLNEQGYMFKRLGYHLPPALEKDQAILRIVDLVEKEPAWTITNNASFSVADFSYASDRTTQDGTSPSTTSSLQVGSWNAYFGGWIPDTNFFYYSEFDIVMNGSTDPQLVNAHLGYAGGSARSSWYVALGRDHLQMSEGTRAAAVYSLLPKPALLFEIMSPTNFLYDQSPVGVDLGYTWASNDYKRVFAASTKVTNGDNADGSEILAASGRNSKDVWTDIDFWYAPESGVTFIDYYGTKDNVQTDPTGAQFTFQPHIRRQGVFANYKLLSKVDFLGGFMHSNDDWQAVQGGELSSFIGNDYYGAVDYYINQGLAVSGRFDRLNQRITGATGVGLQNTHDWTIGVNKTFTQSGNIVGRVAYSDLVGRDPIAAAKSTDKLFQADVAFNY